MLPESNHLLQAPYTHFHQVMPISGTHEQTVLKQFAIKVMIDLP